MKAVLLATALLTLGVSAVHAGPYSGNHPRPATPQGPFAQPGTIVVMPQDGVLPRIQRYPGGLVRNDDGSPMLDSEEHTGLGDRATQPCVFCGGVGR